MRNIPHEISHDGLLERWITDTRPDLTVEVASAPAYSPAGASRILFTISDGNRIDNVYFDYDWPTHSLSRIQRDANYIDRMIEFLLKAFAAFPTNTQASIARSARYRPRTKLQWHFR